MFCQPVGQIDIKIFFCRRRIFPGNYRERTFHFKDEQNNSFDQKKAKPNPDPHIDFVTDNGIKQVK